MAKQQQGISVEFAFEGKSQTLTLPDPGKQDLKSAFILGLPKAGSTLLNRIMQPLCEEAGLAAYGLHHELRRLGIPPAKAPANVAELFLPTGYVYLGFRSFPYHFAIPGFASGRTILLVRDPRDMVVSLYFSLAHSHTKPGQAASDSLLKTFNERRQQAQEQDIDSFVLSKTRAVQNYFASIERNLDGIDHKCWRYEDIIFDKERWTNEMLDYLELSVPQKMVRTIVARNDIKPSTEASTEHIRKVTPGDHKDKLNSGTIEKLNQALAPILRRYGYE